MKKFYSAILPVIILCLLISVPVSAAPQTALEAIIGSANNILAENFSDSGIFEGKTITNNDTAKTIPGWGMIAESSEISGIDVSSFGEKAYAIPLSDGDAQKDIGIRIHATAAGTKLAYLDVWNIPAANIAGADKYRFEYNFYADISDAVKSGEILSEFSFYTTDVPSATKRVGVVAFKRDGTLVRCTDSSKNTYAALKNENGDAYTFQNKAWQHVVLDFDAKENTYDFTLNGETLLKGQKLTNPVIWDAQSGAYRIRLSYKPLEGDTQTFILLDDILFAKYVEANSAPQFTSVTTKNNLVSENTDDFSTETAKISFQTGGSVSDSSVSILKDGTTPVAFKGANDKGAYTITFNESIAPLKSYKIVFDRWLSADGKTFMTEPTEISLFSRSGKAVVSDFAFSKSGKPVQTLSGVDETVSCSAKVFSTAGTDAILVVSLYDSDGTMVKTWFSSQETIGAKQTKTLSVSLDGFTGVANGELKAVVWDNLTNVFPLWNDISIR